MKDVAVIMGSKSDYIVMKECEDILKEFDVSHDIMVVSAHRTPDRLFNFGKNAIKNGYKVIIAGAGGAAHLPGMVASLTSLPVIGVPVETKYLRGLDSLYSIVQMPSGIPVATVAINGAKNAGLLAISILSIHNRNLSDKLIQFRDKQTASVSDIINITENV